jgi:Gas vesicle synthesis protein GvpL/GvpF
VTVLYLYALAPAPLASAEPLGTGLAGEPLRAVPCGRLLALVGEVAAPPAVTAEALAGQDAAVRRLADVLPALLPVRFGEHAAGEAELAEHLAPLAAELSEALERVAGCVQMTLRVFRTASSLPGHEAALPVPVPAAAPEGGPGTRYLAARRQAVEQARAVPEIAPLRAALAPLLRGERAERLARSERGPAVPSPPGPLSRSAGEGERGAELVATVFHLIERGSVERYGRLLAEGAHQLPGVRVSASGPWPAYAFAPGGGRL